MSSKAIDDLNCGDEVRLDAAHQVNLNPAAFCHLLRLCVFAASH